MLTPTENRPLMEKSRIQKTLLDKKLQSDPVGARTRDLRIKSPLLYQLSYRVAGQVRPSFALVKRERRRAERTRYFIGFARRYKRRCRCGTTTSTRIHDRRLQCEPVLQAVEVATLAKIFSPLPKNSQCGGVVFDEHCRAARFYGDG